MEEIGKEETVKAITEGVKEAFLVALEDERSLKGRGWIAEAIQKGVCDAHEELDID